MITSLPHRVINNDRGQPEEVIISWDTYVEIGEMLGLDFAADEAQQLREALHDSRAGNRAEFVSISEVE